MLPVVHDREGGEQFGIVLVFNDAIGGIAVNGDSLLFEGHQGSAQVFGRGDDQWTLLFERVANECQKITSVLTGGQRFVLQNEVCW